MPTARSSILASVLFVAALAGEVQAAPGVAPPASETTSDARALEPRDLEWSIGASLSVMVPSPHHNLRDEHDALEPYGTSVGGALRVGFLPVRYAGAEIEGMRLHSSTDSDGSAAIFGARIHAIAQFPLGRFVPFALFGGGALGGASSSMGTDTDPALHFGAGMKLALIENVSLRLDLRDTLIQRSNAAQGHLTHDPELQIGVAVALEPRHERCVPAVAPRDSDRDGIVDPSDRCPLEPGLVPDGCPDGDVDGDGISDSKDVCPTEPGGARRGGCPVRDTDSDGLPDEYDHCPSEPGTVNGCPDLDPDHDGVLAPNDRCPDEPETHNGFDDDDGCPDEVPEKVRKFTGVIQGIEFDTGKDTIRRVSEGVLNAALLVLQEFPQTRIEISGHTDDVGKPEDNLTLSRQRAEAVKKWFVEHGMDEKRIRTRGAGSEQPIADNKGQSGRQKNRRIEFKLLP